MEEEAAVQQLVEVEVVVEVEELLLEEEEVVEILQAVVAEEVEGEEVICFSHSSVDLHRLTNQSVPDIQYVGFPGARLCTWC